MQGTFFYMLYLCRLKVITLMKKILLSLSVVLIAAFSFHSCKKDRKEITESSTPETTVSKMSAILSVQDGAAVKYKEALATHDSLGALIEMGKWIIAQDGVDKAFLIDNSVITVEYKNGLRSSIMVIPVTADGRHLTRGGGSGALTHFRTTQGDKTIGNNKVIVFIPFMEEFYGAGYNTAKFDGGQPVNVTVVTNKNADLATINSFAQYGFIILNTHGMTHGFEILTGVEKLDQEVAPGQAQMSDDELKALLAAENNLPLDKIENGELELSFEIYREVNTTKVTCANRVMVTNKYIRNIPKLTDAVVFGNHCFSGFNAKENNMVDAWASAGAKSYYGYAFDDGRSTFVDNGFALRMEDSLIKNLVIDNDTTGIAHLANDVSIQSQPGAKAYTGGIQVQVAEGVTQTQYTTEHPQITLTFNFRHFSDPGYKYGCGTFTDPRDGEVYRLACIGTKKWFAENLRYAGAGVCYANSDGNCEQYGRLYTMQEAMEGNSSDANPSTVKGICPQGWHVPSKAEWEELFNEVGGIEAAKTKLRSAEGWPVPNNNTDAFGFGLTPSGGHSHQFVNLGTSAYFWTASATQAGYWGVNAYNPDIYLGAYIDNSPQIWKFSCRCVQD